MVVIIFWVGYFVLGIGIDNKEDKIIYLEVFIVI